MVQNCGFSEFEQFSEVDGWTEGWAEGLPCLLSDQAPKSVVLFTSYAMGEGVRDLDRFLANQTFKLDVVVRVKENKMRSLRLIRDRERDQDRDLFHSNQVISVRFFITSLFLMTMTWRGLQLMTVLGMMTMTNSGSGVRDGEASGGWGAM